MYVFTPRTSAEIKADIADLKLSFALANDTDPADTESDLASLYEELEEAEYVAKEKRAEAKHVGGLDLVKVARAFGPSLPKDWDEEIK